MSRKVPTDDEILAALPTSGFMQTYQIANRLNHAGFNWVDTPWVYRRMLRFEKHKRVLRDYSALWGNTVFWTRAAD